MAKLLDDIVSDRTAFAEKVRLAIEEHQFDGPDDTGLSTVLFGTAWPCLANVCKMAAQGIIAPEGAANAVSVLLDAGADPLLWDDASGNDPFGTLLDYIFDANGFVPDLSEVGALLLSAAPCALDRYIGRFSDDANATNGATTDWFRVLHKALKSKGQGKMVVHLDAAILAMNTPEVSSLPRSPRL